MSRNHAKPRPTDDIFELIQSLSPSERSFYKKSTRFQEGDKKYVKLFDVLTQMDEYDETRILQKLEDVIHPSQFAQLKNYLYYDLLEVLDFYRNKKVSSA